MTSKSELIRLLETLKKDADLAITCIENGTLIDDDGFCRFAEPTLKPAEMAIGRFIVRGRFKSLTESFHV